MKRWKKEETEKLIKQLELTKTYMSCDNLEDEREEEKIKGEKMKDKDIEKAIDILNDPEADMVYTVEEIDLACLVAIDALKKRLPQKGIPYNSAKNHNFVECGTCNRDMGMYYQYCPKCGQKALESIKELEE